MLRQKPQILKNQAVVYSGESFVPFCVGLLVIKKKQINIRHSFQKDISAHIAARLNAYMEFLPFGFPQHGEQELRLRERFAAREGDASTGCFIEWTVLAGLRYSGFRRHFFSEQLKRTNTGIHAPATANAAAPVDDMPTLLETMTAVRTGLHTFAAANALIRV
ncbi:MAG: hypothetical protein ABFD11_05100 [Christensenella sp.]